MGIRDREKGVPKTGAVLQAVPLYVDGTRPHIHTYTYLRRRRRPAGGTRVGPVPGRGPWHASQLEGPSLAGPVPGRVIALES